jgi:hypothetical protein
MPIEKISEGWGKSEERDEKRRQAAHRTVSNSV